MKLARLFALIAVLGWPSLSLAANTAATVQKPVTSGNCAAYGTYPNVADSGVGCANNQVTISDGVHGSMLLAPSTLLFPNSAAILNTKSQQPLTFLKGVATTGTDAGDFKCYRDANYAGSPTQVRGYVNPCFYVYTIARAGTGTGTPSGGAFEWPFLARLDNYSNAADATENTAGYIQARKYGTAPTFAFVSEIYDDTPNPIAGTITDEHDMTVTGTDNNNGRVMLDMYARNTSFTQGGPGVASEVAWGIRLNSDAYTTLKNGITTYGATIGNAAIALGAGQKICFDGVTCSNYWSQSGNVHRFYAGGNDALEVNSLGVNTPALATTSGNVMIAATQKLCLDGTSCANYLTETGGTVLHLYANGADSMQVGSLGTNVPGLATTSGGVYIPTGQKFCLDSTTCANYLSQSGGTLTIASSSVGSQTTMGSLSVLSLASTGNVDVAGGQKLCLDGLTCSNYLTQSGGAITMAASGSGVTLPAATAPTLTSTGNIVVSTNQKLCLNGSSCTVYIVYDGTSIQFFGGGATKFQMNMSSGNGGPAGAVTSGVSTGVTCGPASPTSSWTSNGGINTHC